ncbi:MAG: hypothetical protein KME23_18010 [Goleter apudmare HA4340-LM2]|jgi:ElaB/YqjD/DUF883 family membrane-anchored ribosome-binding protein|nr:hypothetical protein [Goleter apudmare HA4340-LM2]
MAKPKRLDWQISSTQLLIIGLLIGYLGFVWWLGIRLVVLLSGGVIVVLAIASWLIQLKHPKTNPTASSANLLQTDVFFSHISHLDHQIPDVSRPLWRSVQQQAQVIQQIAIQIAQQESTFTPDLLETLHTVLDLVDQLVQALQITPKLRTPRYRELAEQQLQSSRNRLQKTQDQLQELHDQIAVETLERRYLSTPSVIATKLQTLIADNEKGIIGAE